MDGMVRKYCSQCDEVTLWNPDDHQCDCGMSLLGEDSGVTPIKHLIWLDTYLDDVRIQHLAIEVVADAELRRERERAKCWESIAASRLAAAEALKIENDALFRGAAEQLAITLRRENEDLKRLGVGNDDVAVLAKASIHLSDAKARIAALEEALTWAHKGLEEFDPKREERGLPQGRGVLLPGAWSLDHAVGEYDGCNICAVLDGKVLDTDGFSDKTVASPAASHEAQAILGVVEAAKAEWDDYSRCGDKEDDERAECQSNEKERCDGWQMCRALTALEGVGKPETAHTK